jgi:hypothetical protein
MCIVRRSDVPLSAAAIDQREEMLWPPYLHEHIKGRFTRFTRFSSRFRYRYSWARC